MFKIIRFLKNKFFLYLCKNTIKRHGKSLFIGGYCRFTNNTNVGDCCSFNGIRVLGRGRVDIGDYFHSGVNCQILTENHNINGEKIPYDNTYIIKDVNIGSFVWFGNNVIILPGVTIGDGAVIQAGSVVVSDIPKYSIAGGHPAKVFSTRDIDKYEILLSNKLFHQ